MISAVQQSQDEVADSSPPQLQAQSEPSSVKSKSDVNEVDDDPENILSDSLQTLYDYQPITLTSAGSLYTYTHSMAPQISVTLRTPDTEAANWSLHASSVWIASTQLASNIDLLRLDELSRRMSTGIAHGEKRTIRVLELGAAAGLPSILIAKLYPHFRITATDYPDPRVIQTLSQNIKQNGVEMNCHAMPLAWGSDSTSFLLSISSTDDHGLDSSSERDNNGFDVIIAADTLWNPILHDIFVSTLQGTLRRDSESRIHLVAGLHTGRYTIQSFLRTAGKAGFRIVQIVEREVQWENRHSDRTKARMREWDVARAGWEEEKDRRGWNVWIELARE